MVNCHKTGDMNEVKRFEFYDVFGQNADGSLSPKRQINLNGISFGPGVAFSRGVIFGGVDIFQFLGRPIAALEENGVLIIKGYY